MPNVTFLNFNQ